MAFKTPSLRDLTHTAPYMHDGSLATLQAVVAHYAGGFVRRPTLAPNMNRRLRLTAQEKADLVAFLRTLSSEKGAPGTKQGSFPSPRPYGERAGVRGRYNFPRRRKFRPLTLTLSP